MTPRRRIAGPIKRDRGRVPHRTSDFGDGERGSGTVLCLAIIGVLVCLTGGVVAVAGASVAKQRASGAADVAALAAADVASGRLPGSPCQEAARVAGANGAVLSSCAVAGTVATVTASIGYLGFTVTVQARAGPPAD
jgi:secretion/DNA translocation related TadE-like protein